MFDYTLLTFDTQPDFGYSLTQFTHQLPDDAGKNVPFSCYYFDLAYPNIFTFS